MIGQLEFFKLLANAAHGVVHALDHASIARVLLFLAGLPLGAVLCYQRLLGLDRQVDCEMGQVEEERLILVLLDEPVRLDAQPDRKSTRLNSSHLGISYAV